MLKKIIHLLKHPSTDYKKIYPFLLITLRKIKQKVNFFERYQIKKNNNFRKKEYARLAKSYIKNNRIKVHYGCGPRVLKGWINIDLHFVPAEPHLKSYTNEYYPEAIRGDKNDFFAIDITKTGLPFPDNSVDVIFHEDFIEHLEQKEQILFLAETFRVLKPNSIHRINTPNLLASMERYSDFKKGVLGVYAGEWNNHGHRNLFTPNSLDEIAQMIGYNKVLFNSRNKSTSKEIPKEYRPDPIRTEKGNIFADLIK